MSAGNISYQPRSLKREGDSLVIDWADGARTKVTWKKLRDHCPCATCQEEQAKPADPFRILSPQELQAGPLAPVAMHPRGHYAYQIAWNDGHDTGIYSLQSLRELSDPA